MEQEAGTAAGSTQRKVLRLRRKALPGTWAAAAAAATAAAAASIQPTPPSKGSTHHVTKHASPLTTAHLAAKGDFPGGEYLVEPCHHLLQGAGTSSL